MDRETALKKIQKCMALAKSSEPHEAAAALRQAQKLMESFDIEHPELLAMGVKEEWAKSGAKKTPPRYEVMLASAVASAFGCDLLFTRRINQKATDIIGGYSFIGVAASPVVATYTFQVLGRQLRKARAEYIRTALRRHRKNKTAAADLFCNGWVYAVRALIAEVAPNAEQAEAIDAYMRINHAKVTTLAVRERELSHGGKALDHTYSGHAAGQRARLHQGVGAANNDTRLLG